MTKEEIGNKPASEKTLREDFIGQAVAGLVANADVATPGFVMKQIGDTAIFIADAVIERLAAEKEQIDD